MNHGNHLKHMLIAGAAVLAGLLVFGVPTGSALLFAVALACPVGMMAMMYFMGRDQQGHGGQPDHTGHAGHTGHGQPVADVARRD